MADLTVLAPNHGYSDDTPIFVSWLNGIYYTDDVTAKSFKLTDGADGPRVAYTTAVTTGYVRRDDSPGVTTITGLSHLEGESVYLTSGGDIVGQYTVSNGSITAPRILTTYQVGIPYSMKIRTMRLELPSSQGVQSRIKRINETVVRHLRSKGGQAGQEYCGTEYLQDLNCTYDDESKDATVLTAGGYSSDGYTVIKSSEPYPFNVLATIISFEVAE